jgi:HEAT repeat protein
LSGKISIRNVSFSLTILQMDDLRELVNYLHTLGKEPPTTENRKVVEGYLKHKRQGIQSTAAQVLTKWGGRESVALIKQWLLYGYQKRSWFHIRGVAIKCLAQLIDAQDTDWVLDLYFAVEERTAQHELYWLVTALPSTTARQRLINALPDVNWLYRLAAVVAIGNMDYPDRHNLLTPLLNDEDQRVRSAAVTALTLADELRMYRLHRLLRNHLSKAKPD